MSTILLTLLCAPIVFCIALACGAPIVGAIFAMLSTALIVTLAQMLYFYITEGSI